MNLPTAHDLPSCPFPVHPSPPTPTPADRERGLARLKEDLDFVFQDPRWFALAELRHLRANFHRLARGTYSGPDDSGCIFGLLTELRTGDGRIGCRETLTRFFTGGSGVGYRELPVYQPAKWIVRAWDLERCERYAGVTLDREVLLEALDRAIAVRESEASVLRRWTAFVTAFAAR